MRFTFHIPIVIGIAFQVHSITAPGLCFLDSTCSGSTKAFVLQEMGLAIQLAEEASKDLYPATSAALTFFNYMFAEEPITSLWAVFGGGQAANLVGLKNLQYSAGDPTTAGAYDIVSHFFLEIANHVIKEAGTPLMPLAGHLVQYGHLNSSPTYTVFCQG